MRMTKHQFYLFLAVMFAIAAILSIWVKSWIKADPALSPDLGFLMLYGMAILFFMRVELWAAAFWTVYAGSLLFCFFYLIVAPLEAPIMLALFIWPAVLIQRRELGFWQFSAISAVLMFISWKFLGKPVLFFLLLPTCQVVAMRLSSRVRARYSRQAADLGPVLSQRQREQQGVGNAGSEDWWDIFQNELETFPHRIQKFWDDLLGNSPRHDPEEERGPDLKMLQIQDAGIMSRSLTDLCRRDPKFASDRFIKRTEETFWKIQKAWYGQEPAPIQHLVGDALFEQFRQQIDDQQASGIRFQDRKMTIFENRIVQVNSDRNFDIVHVFLRASSADALVDLKTGKVLAEEDERQQFSEYWSFLRRPSAKTLEKPGLLEGSCPNCSAPLEIGQATVCGVCKSFLRSGTYDWVLAKITQACEWEYTEPTWLPGWQDMIRLDPNITVQQIEDRGGVMFWMLRMAERQKKSEPLRRYATSEWCERVAETGGSPIHDWSYMDGVALGSVSLKGFRLDPDWDRLYLLVAWRGIPIYKHADEDFNRGKRIPRIVRDVFVLIRRHGLTTDERITLSSAHCPRCGAPLASAYSVSCEYCNLILNEGTAGWILEKETDERDPDFQKLHQTKVTAQDSPGENREHRSAIDVLTVMAQVLLADGKIDEREMKLLKEMGARYRIPPARIDSILSSLKEGQVHVPSAGNLVQSWALLEAAARMALSDNELSPEEERTLNLLGQFLGYSQADVQRAIKKEQKRLHALVPHSNAWTKPNK
ncbi:MAG: TIM44-like domain-containing protein [Candidatus Ozemobacteraceae bacterium]